MCHFKPFLLQFRYLLWLLNSAEGLLVSRDFRTTDLETVLYLGPGCSCSEDFNRSPLRSRCLVLLWFSGLRSLVLAGFPAIALCKDYSARQFRNTLAATTWLVLLSNHSGFSVGLGVDRGDLNLLSSGRTDTPSPYSHWEVKSSKKLGIPQDKGDGPSLFLHGQFLLVLLPFFLSLS